MDNTVLNMATMDPNWFLSALMESTATIVAIIAGFLITSLVNRIGQKEDTNKTYTEAKTLLQKQTDEKRKLSIEFVVLNYLNKHLTYENVKEIISGKAKYKTDSKLAGKPSEYTVLNLRLDVVFRRIVKKINERTATGFNGINFSSSNFKFKELREDSQFREYFTDEQLIRIGIVVVFSKKRMDNRGDERVLFDNNENTVKEVLKSNERVPLNEIRRLNGIEQRTKELTDEINYQEQVIQKTKKEYEDSLKIAFLKPGEKVLFFLVVLGIILPGSVMLWMYQGDFIAFRCIFEGILIVICGLLGWFYNQLTNYVKYGEW